MEKKECTNAFHEYALDKILECCKEVVELGGGESIAREKGRELGEQLADIEISEQTIDYLFEEAREIFFEE